jgi:2-polyprenyl-3-methyl-5-hydroxy-6-metoxy-1,4-benzoquinol methylase
MTDRSGIQFWDRVAEKYAARRIKDVASYEAMLTDVTSRLAATDRVLEIGCGTGGTAIRLAPGVLQWTATDLSPEMVRIARAKPAPDNVTFAIAGADLTSAGASYDAVCAFLILHLVKDIRTTLATIHKHLKPGGLLLSKTFCFGDMNIVMRRALIPALQALGMVPTVTVFTGQYLRQAIVEAGFEVDTERSFGRNRHARYIVARRLS